MKLHFSKPAVLIINICLLLVINNAQAQMSGSSPGLVRADSLYMAKDWAGAKKAYKKAIKDTSANSIGWNRLGYTYYKTGNNDAAMAAYTKALKNNPIPPLKASVYSRMASINAGRKNYDAVYANIDSALCSGYNAYADLDTLKEFAPIRDQEPFKKLRKKVYGQAYPCTVDEQARTFDFWVGEWNVYATGTNIHVGHSLIQIIAGGCSILENWESKGVFFSGKSLNYIDPTTNKWKQKWVGSDGAVRDFVNGEYKDGVLRYTFETTDPQNHKLTGKFTFYNLGPDEVRQLKETSADEGKTWQTVYDFNYKRVKK